jgi:hypothetical protein
MTRRFCRILAVVLGLASLTACHGNQALPGVQSSFLSFPTQSMWCDSASATYCPGEKAAAQP